MVLSNNPTTEVIFFDLGFTLINYAGNFRLGLLDSYKALSNALHKFGYSIDPAYFSHSFDIAVSNYYESRELDLIERPVEDIIRSTLYQFGVTAREEDLMEAMKEMYRLTQACWYLEDDAIPTLNELKQAGFRLGLITNAANAWDANQLIDKFQLRDYFEAILISAEEKYRKPDPRIYASALEKLRVNPASAAMVGDTLVADILGAQKSGMKGVWISRRADRAENDRAKGKIKPDATVSSLAKIPSLFITPGL